MTRDDIVKWASEAAIMPPNWGATENQWRTLHVFAALVAVAEREACAVMVDHILKEGGGTYGDAIRARGQM